jgi:hypothetical protein
VHGEGAGGFGADVGGAGQAAGEDAPDAAAAPAQGALEPAQDLRPVGTTATGLEQVEGGREARRRTRWGACLGSGSGGSGPRWP